MPPATVWSVSDFQRIVVVSTNADEAEVAQVRKGMGAGAIVLTAPTAEGKRIVQGLRHDAHPEVLLARGPRPVPLGRAALGGVGLAVLMGVLSLTIPFWVLPTMAAAAGLVLLALPGRRWLGQSVLIAVAVSLGVALLAVAGSDRFPGAW
jgi:hypothetical protein